MDTSVCVRLILLSFSIVSLALQITAMVIRNWFGFSFAIHSNERTVSQEITGGLFFISPAKICVHEGNGTDCKGLNRLSPSDNRTFDATNTLLRQSVIIPRGLVMTGLAAAFCGLVFLYCYLCLPRKSNKQRCIGGTAAIFWIFAALPEFTAMGVQVFANLNMKNSINFIAVTVNELGMNLHANFITPWAVILLGVGASLNVVVGILVALPTCGQEDDRKAILHSKLSNGRKDKFRILQYDDEYDSSDL